jgi:hypothetical protein
MSEIRSACLLQRLDDGILSLTLCVRHAEGGALAPVRSTDRRVARSSPTRRNDFVKCYSAGARPKNFQTLNGYEAGLFGMEGRGLYAGGNVGGVYAQVAQNGGWSYGFQEQMYLAYGNNTSKEGADGKTGSVVSAELWLPTLGKYGHFAFGETYDVSNQGLENKLKSELYKYAKTDEKRDAINNMKYASVVLQMLENSGSFQEVHHYNGHKDGTKRTFREKDSGAYGNIELIVRSNDTYYSSYNYGNNIFSHILIDYFGYKWRNE